MTTNLLSFTGLLAIAVLGGEPALGESHDLARIKPNVRTGFCNAGWCFDRYSDLEPLAAHTRIVVADLKGPGVIRHIHCTRHRPKELFARGIVLEIWFDEADQPAVSCPLADFFGDGCNGDSMYFSATLVECAPWSYNCYFPMPFRSHAKVTLRNDTDRPAHNYTYVEWESLPERQEDLGYFHATYRRKCFQLTPDSEELLFEVEGKGHLIGRQYSIVTHEPLFKGFQFVMEGNNEVDIDGRERAVDYLGTEDSFTFSWGFQTTFAGLRAGMPLVDTGSPHRLSIYRFHDHMPIRFNEGLRWRINWRHERMVGLRRSWAEAVEEGGCRVDYASVYYWYQSTPGGFEHEHLRPVEERRKPMLIPE